MPKKLSNRRKDIIQQKISDGINVKKRRSDYTENEWKRHLKHRKKEQNKRAYKRRRAKYRKTDYYKKHHMRRIHVTYYVCEYCGKIFGFRKTQRTQYVRKFCNEHCKFLGYMRATCEKRLNKVRARYANRNYTIIITENYQEVTRLQEIKEQKEAFKWFKQYLNENKNVLFPQRYIGCNGGSRNTNYEIILLKYVEKEKEIVNQFPDEMGRLIDNEIKTPKHKLKCVKEKKMVIINKEEWKVEETFNILGHTEVENVSFILDNFIFNNNEQKEIVIYSNRLLIKSGQKLKIIIHKYKEVIYTLYTWLEQYVKTNGRKYENKPPILFFGVVDKSPILREEYDKLTAENGF